MRTDTLDIRALAAEFTAAHPVLDPSEQRLVLAIFRLLGEGKPFDAGELAARAGLARDEAAYALDRLPMVQRDDHGRVLAYGGLTLEPTSHVLEVDGHTLHTWCALDTLFMPELLGRPARVRSRCPETRTEISLDVDAAGAHGVTPADAVMTLHGAGAQAPCPHVIADGVDDCVQDGHEPLGGPAGEEVAAGWLTPVS